MRGGRIVHAGPRDSLPAGLAADRVLSCEGRLVTPGLVDCHTHIVHGGAPRPANFEMRLEGASYEEIARAGGGIVLHGRGDARGERGRTWWPRPCHGSTRCWPRASPRSRSSPATGSSARASCACCAPPRRLGGQRDVRVVTSFLGAHALPAEAAGDRAGYLHALCEDMLPAAAAEGLVDAVDGFCEGIAFSPDEIARVLSDP